VELLTESHLPLKLVASGKVRDICEVNDVILFSLQPIGVCAHAIFGLGSSCGESGPETVEADYVAGRQFE
jgi:hypothetical protein